MSIRKRLFLSYILLVSFVLVYGLLLFSFGLIKKHIERDISQLYQSKEIWNDLLISMNELQLNWAGGETFKQFREKDDRLEQLLKHMADDAGKFSLDRNRKLQKRKRDLYNTWSIARESTGNIIRLIDSPDFLHAVKPLEKTPGLQQFNHLWAEMFYNGDAAEKHDAYALKQVIDAIEFFPIYSETLNHLFNVIIGETELYTDSLNRAELIASVLFFLAFLFIYLIFALRVSDSLSRPIIRLSHELASFMGKTLKQERESDSDEVELLSRSVKNLISHYTELSRLAGRIAQGEIDSPILLMEKQGIVGNALKEINLYLLELARTSQWITEGNYGAEIRVKSEKDILASNFNIMSRVIDEKINRLSNILGAVEESIVVTDFKGNIVETNHKFHQLVAPGSVDSESLPGENLTLFFPGQRFPDGLLEEGRGRDISTEMTDREGNLIPVRITKRSMPEVRGRKDKLMLFITNESVRVRMEREKEKFRSHAVEAELRALRAQINPHFLFNTLNGIAHLVESGGNGAVIMIEKLAELFRYSLVSTRRTTVQLSEELNIIRQFLDIEKMRFEENLTFEFLVDDSFDNFPIPPMLLQPVVENAVKYGADEEGRIHVTITVGEDEGHLLISVADRGCRVVNHLLLLEQKGTGIRNVNSRLNTLYDQSLQFTNNRPRGLKVIFRIPETGNAYDPGFDY